VRARRLALASGPQGGARELASEIRGLAAVPPDVGPAVREILTAVRERGDEAVVELTRRFDSAAAGDDLRVPPEALGWALSRLDPAIRRGLEVAVENVGRVVASETARQLSVDLPQGQHVGLKEIPVRRAGVYAPGGRAAYPSTVVMCCVPARAAGVKQVAVVTPPGPDGKPNELILAACALCGIEEVYSIGGAQAIAALAFGTASVEAVDVVVGPGNHYVQEAKRQVVGRVGIDGVAGPSELAVIADAEADHALVALDLGAQAEHGDDSLLALLSPSQRLLDEVEAEADRLTRANETVSDAPLALVQVPSLDAAVEIANAIAPEHLQLACEGADRLAKRIRSSGCVFVGSGAGTAFGDYVAGSNHVLPTGGAARFASPLGATQFRRRQALVSLPVPAARALAPYVSSVARAEGFPVHAESAEARETLSTRQSQ
jgi:histidinol dehydrogenase